MNNCIRCNKTLKGKGLKGYCNSCYQTERKLNSMPTYALPDKGEVKYSPDGKVICHICGKAFNKVLSHATQYHGIQALDYKKEFGLNLGKGLISDSTKLKYQTSIELNYDTVVIENLIKRGEKTRFIVGSPGRTADKVSLQCRKEFSKRLRAISSEKQNYFSREIKQKEIAVF